MYGQCILPIPENILMKQECDNSRFITPVKSFMTLVNIVKINYLQTDAAIKYNIYRQRTDRDGTQDQI